MEWFHKEFLRKIIAKWSISNGQLAIKHIANFALLTLQLASIFYGGEIRSIWPFLTARMERVRIDLPSSPKPFKPVTP
jgi:hypothetical protein